MKYTLFKIKLILSFWMVIFTGILFGQEKLTPNQYLQLLQKVLPEDRYKSKSSKSPWKVAPHVNPEDFTWNDWLHRTGELPPDFDTMPSIPFLPNPLILDEGKNNIPIKTIHQWEYRRQEIKKQFEYWVTGSIPPSPDYIEIEILSEKKLENLTERNILIRFGPGLKAELNITLLIPPGKGPFPVFICPWKKDRYDWVQAAVRRGYIGCRFTATDPKYGYDDDSENYEEIWWPDYDFSTITRWAWSVSRVIDYLYTLEFVNKDMIGLTGLSRNGKMALIAAAFDERIGAVVPISGGTGGENPFRYTNEKFDNESIAQITTNFPHWFHPRLRFFVGREHKLPVDQNLLMALVAPRGLMLTSSIFEGQGNPWGIEQAFKSAKEVYNFLGHENNIVINLRHGLHAPSARDIENYLDFFDFIFGRNNIVPKNRLFYDYSFSKWLGLSNESIDLSPFLRKGIDDLLIDSDGTQIHDIVSWEEKIPEIRKKIRWGLGDEPASVGPGDQPDYMLNNVIRPVSGFNVNVQDIGFGRLYTLDQNEDSRRNDSKLPVVIYLHEYSYSTGYGRNFRSLLDSFLNLGFAVYTMDQIGFGTRIEEGKLFYERFPNWSKMGRMVADVRWCVDDLSKLENIDPNQIYVVGYSLGGTVGIYSAALDDRIAGVISVSGFTPMRLDIKEKGTEGIMQFSHLHGLIPRLGFFVGKENKIPYDYHEILACIAPRPILIISPSWDRYSTLDDIEQCVNEVHNIYDLYNSSDQIKLKAPNDYNRFSPGMQNTVIKWLGENVQRQ